MKLSTYHKACGDTVLLNMPVFPSDYTYASVLFEKNKNLFIANEYGGPAFGGGNLNIYMKPDYDLYPQNDFSLGYTFRGCCRGCDFCKVPLIEKDFRHYSIWDFHDSKFKKICLLNNNTFFDPDWRTTFEEIWEADLSVIDENGYDLRLLDDEKADALKRTRFTGKLHFAWDRIEDGKEIIRGLELLKKHKINNVHVYVLIGYDTSFKQDLYRCQRIVDFGFDPYVMPFNQSKKEKRFKRFFDTFMWRKYKTIAEAWQNYSR
jgi:hypothetical protein